MADTKKATRLNHQTTKIKHINIRRRLNLSIINKILVYKGLIITIDLNST